MTQGLGCTVLLLATTVPSFAQAPVGQGVFIAPPTPNADRLAAEMRALAANPGDVRALLSAGELSVVLEDPAAALQFFARAEKIDPSNPRIPAGRGGALLRLGRPGEALRLFADAERRGVPTASLAPNRALAYDLIGQPAHAQEQYRAAIAANPREPELARAYALSLGISGDSKRALATLDPLLRERDRAAWRARAFILALDGEVGEAQQIATNMMPGFGTAFSPFFQQLAQLRDPADRAFAVHRGEVGRTPARLADATMAPALPAIVAAQPVRLAAVPIEAAPVRETRRSRREARAARRNRGSRTPIPAVALAAAAPTPTPAPVTVAAIVPTPVPTPAAPVGLVLRPSSSPVVLASNQPVPRTAGPAAIDPATVTRVAVANSGAARLEAAAARPIDPIVSVPLRTGAVSPAPAFSTTTVLATPDASANTVVAAATAPPPAKAIGAEDDVLARILSGIAIPAAELGVAPSTPAPALVAAASPPPAPVVTKPEPVAAASTGKVETAVPKSAAKKPAPKKTEAKKPEAKKPAEPSRHWVQVAGGANKADLPKEWKRLAGLAPETMKRTSPWTTPLRFTNRLLAGPFKSSGEAQTFVNAIGKQGISAFAWTSEAGQKVEKLPSK